MPPETQLLPVALAAFGALAAWGLLRNFGGKEYRRYAVPVAALILFIGLDEAFDFPAWSYLLALFVAPFFYHRGVRAKLEAAARAIPEVAVEGCDYRLALADDLPGKPVAVWRIAPREGSGAPAGLPLLTLEFQGEVEDEYQVLLWAPLRPFKPVSFVVHHKDAATLAARLTSADAIDVSGAQEWMVVRGKPSDFALEVLDQQALALPRAMLGLRSEERELALQVDGGAARVVSNRTFTKPELETLLQAFLVWHARLCEVLATYIPPRGED